MEKIIDAMIQAILLMGVGCFLICCIHFIVSVYKKPSKRNKLKVLEDYCMGVEDK
jgi:hypothetical protein